MIDFVIESQEDLQTQEQIKRIIDLFNIEELRSILNSSDNQIHFNIFLQKYLLQKINSHLVKAITELQSNPSYDCSQLLVFILENTNQNTFQNDIFDNYTNLLKILEYTDHLHIYDLVFQILSNRNIFRIWMIPRILYLEKIFYCHINFLCSKKFNLIDYYYTDPKYRELCHDPIESLQFDIEYQEPTQLDESYEDLQINRCHQKKLSGQLQIKKIQIIDDNSISALALSRNLLNMQSQSFSPLIDILKYRILIRRGLQTNPLQTKNIIIKLHTNSLKILKIQKSIVMTNHKMQRLYHDVIGELIENNNFNLFQLETIDPILLVELLKIEQQNYLQPRERYQEFSLKLLSDVLSMRYIEQNEQSQGYPLKYNPKILSESIAKDSQLTSSILNLFIKVSLNNSWFSDDIIRMLIKLFNTQDNRLLLQPEQIEQALLLLNKYITRDLEQFNQYFNDLLTIFEYYINQGQNLQKPTQVGYVQINETESDSIIATCIKAMSQNFSYMRRHQDIRLPFNQMINTDSLLATKISNSNILGFVSNKLTQQVLLTKTTKQALQFISCLANADPSLTVKIINSRIPGILNDIISIIRLEELNLEMTKDIFMFYANICRQENGFELFSNNAIRLIHDLLHYYLIAQEDTKIIYMKKLGQLVFQFIEQNDRMEQYLNETLKQIFSQVQVQLLNKFKNFNLDQDLKSQFSKIAQKKISILSFNEMLFPVYRRIQYRILGQNGYAEIIERFFQIPSFNYIPIKCFNFTNIIEKNLSLIDELEAELGCTLDHASLQYFDENQFFAQYSPKTVEIVSRYSEIFHYYSYINDRMLIETTYNKKIKLFDKCCALLEIVSVINQKPQLRNKTTYLSDIDILLRKFQQLLKGSQMDNNYLQPLNRLFNKLTLQLDNSPNITLEFLILIKRLLKELSFHPDSQKIQDALTSSQLFNNLKDALKHYINIIRIDDFNPTLIQQQNQHFLQIFQLLFPLRQMNINSILPKIILDISTLFQMVMDLYHEKLYEIMEFLLYQISFIFHPSFLGTCTNKQQIQVFLEQLRQYIQQNILKFPISNVSVIYFDSIKFDQIVLFKYLQQTAYSQFNLKLNFKGIEFQNSNYLPWSILLILKLLIQQENFTEQQDLIAIEMLKLLEVLLQQSEICVQCTQALNSTLNILIKLINSNQEVINLLLNGIKKILDSRIMNQTTQDLCINILIQVFYSNRQCINQFIYQMQGLELLFQAKRKFLTQMPILSKFAIAIIYDKTQLRAQIQAKIKKIIFDQEYNEEIKNTNYNLQNRYYQNENTYPICLQPASYNVYTKEQQKIQKNNPNLQSLLNDKFYKEDVKDAMNLLFIESVEEQCFILKNGIRLDTLNSINQNGDSIFQFNFKHTKETQLLLKNFVQQIITFYFDNNGKHQFYCKTLFDVLQYLVSQFPLLLPSLLRINCSQLLQQYKHQIGYEQSELPTKISFLTLITKFILPSYNFIFYISLDNLVLFRKSNNTIVPFGNEIRRIIIKQLYSEICKSIKTLDEKLKRLSFILVLLLQIKSVAKICIKNINEPQDSFNFINTYIEGIKNLDLQSYFIYKDQIFLIISILNLLYNVAACLLLEKTLPILTNCNQKYPQMQFNIIGEMNLEEIQNQIFTFEKGLFTNQISYEEMVSIISKFHLLQWPFFSVGNLQESNQVEEELQIPNYQLHVIKENVIYPEIDAMELEDEENQFTTENVLETEELSLSNLEYDNILNQIMNGQNDNQFYNSIKFVGLIFPIQFQQLLEKLRNMVQVETQNQNSEDPFDDQIQLFEIEAYERDIDRSSSDMQQENQDDLQQLEQQQIQQQHQIFQQQQQAINSKDKISQIVDYLKSKMEKSRQTLKNLGKIDQQFIKGLQKFLYIDDFGENLDYINDLFKILASLMNITNLIINDFIYLLKQMNKNIQQDFLIPSKNELVLDYHQSQELVKQKVLNQMLDLQKSSKCNLSTKNIKQLIYFIELFKGEQLSLLIQFFINQEQFSTIQFSKDYIQILFYKMQKEENIDVSNKLITCISHLWVVEYNRQKIIKFMYEAIEQITQQYQNYLQTENQIDQILIKTNEIERIFFLLDTASKLGKQEQQECEQFLYSPQIQNLMKLTEKIISMIPKQYALQQSPALVPLFNILVTFHQILNLNNTQRFPFLPKLASMEISRCNSDSTEFNFQRQSKEICKKGNVFINIIIKQKLKSLNLRDQEFSSLFVDYFFNNHSNIIDFENKKSYFYLKMRNKSEDTRADLKVRRDHIFDDSYRQIQYLNPRFFRNLHVNFIREQGYDQGGLSQDWIQQLTKEIVDPNNKLFIPTSNKLFCQINTQSYIDADHINKFKFIGKIFAIAILNNLKVFGSFPISFFKHIVGQKLSIFDIQYNDDQIYTTVDYIYRDNVNQNWGIYYSYTIENNQGKKDIELIPGGENIEVTQENKKDFLRKYCYQIMAKNIENQMKAFLEGFYSVIPQQQISIFDSTQLELLLCGQSNIDVEDLILNLQYDGYTPTHQVIIWLQNTLRNFSQDFLAKFLKFLTAFPLMPIGGFKNSRCQISIKLCNYSLEDIDELLPVGHTCSCELDLPPYSQQEILAAKLELAITEGAETFELQ